jgi:hypothetical protein
MLVAGIVRVAFVVCFSPLANAVDRLKASLPRHGSRHAHFFLCRLAHCRCWHVNLSVALLCAGGRLVSAARKVVDGSAGDGCGVCRNEAKQLMAAARSAAVAFDAISAASGFAIAFFRTGASSKRLLLRRE